jgi:hypothetical protein
MKLKAAVLASALIAYLAFGLWHSSSSTARSKNLKPVAAQDPRKPYQGFPDFGHMVTADDFEDMKEQYKKSGQYLPGPFRLAADFPKTKPTQVPDFFSIDFKQGDRWLEYLNRARDFCFDGFIKGGSVEADFIPQNNDKRKWNHLPWMHWGDQGSEGFHGLIKEAPINPQQLTAQQTDQYQVYAVAFYNDFASYTLGRIWANPNDPDPTVTDKRYGRNNGFPVGTVIFKLLFTDAPSDDVDYLQNPVEWTAYITPTWNETTARVVTKVRLVQMDMMIRDERAISTGGWVLATFAYNGALKNSTPWRNLVPLGMMWGNDPTYTKDIITQYPPTKTVINPDLKETRINPSKDVPAAAPRLGPASRRPRRPQHVLLHVVPQHGRVPADGVARPARLLPPTAADRHEGVDGLLPKHPVRDALRPEHDLHGLLSDGLHLARQLRRVQEQHARRLLRRGVRRARASAEPRGRLAERPAPAVHDEEAEVDARRVS